MYSNTGVNNMFGVELPQNSQHHHQKHPNIMAFTHPQHQQQQHEQQTNLSTKQPTGYLSSPNPNPYPSPNQTPCLKPKSQMTQLTNSDEDEPGCANDQENNSLLEGGKRRGGGGNSSNVSPWQRMKWTDNMVRLLIMAVYYIGDEAGNEVVSSDKKKSGAGGGVLQKKGKWKSVSRAMMEKGFYVSPQQCEDKFNDLNKRYKRVNDILGKGTACKVVENQSLLDSMEIAPKMKDEVRKLLNSKHLFFREMCAYHNSCGHGSGPHSTEATAAVGPTSDPQQNQHHHHLPQQHQQVQQQQQQQQSSCLHSSAITPNSMEQLMNDEDDEDDDDDDDEDDDEDEEEHEEGRERKRARIQGGFSSNTWHALQKLNGEIMGVLQNGGKNSWEKKQWMATQIVQLEEEGVRFQSRALELEKERLKWLKFSSKKEREMEKMKIDNERKRLENERMMLLLRQKEIELLVNVDCQQQQQNHTNPSCISA